MAELKAGDKVTARWTTGDGSVLLVPGELVEKVGDNWKVSVGMGITIRFTPTEITPTSQ